VLGFTPTLGQSRGATFPIKGVKPHEKKKQNEQPQEEKRRKGILK
jgi:hypothetical protein